MGHRGHGWRGDQQLHGCIGRGEQALLLQCARLQHLGRFAFEPYRARTHAQGRRHPESTQEEQIAGQPPQGRAAAASATATGRGRYGSLEVGIRSHCLVE